MSKVQTLRAFVEQRLTAAAEEIFGVFGRTISEYEEELCRQQKLLDAVLKARGRLHRTDVQQLLVCKAEPPHIKEEQEELWTNQDGEQRRVQHLNELFKQRLLTAAREDLFGHFDRTVWRYEEEMGRRQKRLDVIFQPQVKLQRAVFHADVPEQQPPQVKEEQEELWTPQEREKLQDIIKFTFTQEEDWKDPKSNDCSVCGLKFRNRGNLIVHTRIHAGEKLFSCTDCGQRFREKSQVKLHKCVDPNKFTSAHISVMMKKRELRTKEDKEKLLSSQPHQTQTEEMETEADGGDCARPEPARNSDPDAHLSTGTEDFPEPKADDSDEWNETRNITKSTCTRVPMKIKEDEEKPQSSQPHQTQTEEMETEADGHDCARPEPARNSDPDAHLSPDTEDFPEPEADDSDEWKETRNITKFTRVPVISEETEDWKDPQSNTCSVCGLRCRNRGNLNVHMRIHAGEKLFSCTDCGQRFREMSQAKMHKCVDPIKKSELRTKKVEEKPQSSQLHQVQTKEMKTEADGGDCGRPEPARNSRKKTYNCSVCNKSCTHYSHLKVHMRTHTGEKPYSCSVCNKCFSQKGYLKLHMTIHTGEKTYRCPVCYRWFSRKGYLRLHMVTHSTETPFICPFCNKGFSRSSCLKSHIRVHTGEKPYSCHFCGKSFPQKNHLDAHLIVHTEDKPFSCPVCIKTFRSRTSIEYHQRIHTGLKPFSCTDCGKSFRIKSHIKMHKCVHPKTEEMETEADGEDCGRPEPARNSDPDAHLTSGTEDVPEPEADDRDESKETRNITRSTCTTVSVKSEEDETIQEFSL